MMTSARSGMTRASRSRIPTSLRPRARKARFSSAVRPDRISLPMISTQAVTIRGGAAVRGVSGADWVIAGDLGGERWPFIGKGAHGHNRERAARLPGGRKEPTSYQDPQPRAQPTDNANHARIAARPGQPPP